MGDDFPTIDYSPSPDGNCQHLEQSGVTASFPIPVRDEMLGSRIGPYKLLSILGEGGFGIVYLADQEKPIRRRVALKILKAGMDTKQILARFDSERQTLAVMDHANIARIFDAGITASGRSYFVMEWVRGEPITTYCDRHKLALEERLELFLTVCQAVQHAHQKGIIHRDITPSNIMVAAVDDQPVPKIIDFGIAKAMTQPLAEQTIFTEQGQLLGTPEYMSPEQAGMNILDIDTRSDIYSLGVLLYELLTGTLPFDRGMLRQAGPEEVRRIIQEVEPPKPSSKISTLGEDSRDLADSRRTDPQSLCRRLRQELDWIVMKTLEKDRTRRYGTAMALADDVQHYLHHEPVHAGPPGSWYRIRKYAWCYRVPLGIAAGCAAFLLAITLLAVRGYSRESSLRADAVASHQRAVQARIRAEEENGKAKDNFKIACDAVKNYYTRVAGDPRLKPHNLEELRRDLLQSANKFYEELINQDANDPDLQLERVWAFIERGNIEVALDNLPEGEAAFNNAIAAATRLTRIDGRQSEYQVCLATGHNNLGNLYEGANRVKEAEAAHKEALAIRRILAEKHPEMPEYQNDLAASHLNLGNLYQTMGRDKEAEEADKAAIAIWKTLAKEHPESPGYRNRLATSYNNLGTLYHSKGRDKEAEDAHKEALAIRRLLAKKYPETPEYKNDLAASHLNLGCVYQATGRAKEAEAADKKAIAIWKTLAEEHSAMPGYQNGLATSYDNLGNVHLMTGRDKEAEAAQQEAFAIRKTLAGKYPEAPGCQWDLAASYLNLGNLFQVTGRNKEAEAADKEAIAIWKRLAEKHPEVPEYRHYLATSHNNLGNLYQATGRATEAEANHKEARAVWDIPAEKQPQTR